MAITNAFGSIAVRNFAVEKGIGWQIVAVAMPLVIAFLIRGGLFPLLIPMLVAPIWMFVLSSATRLRNMLLSEMSYRRRSESIAAQFDFAINNMSHGMCMISAGSLVLVSNAKFAEFFGMTADAAVAHRRLQVLADGGDSSAARFPGSDADRLLDLVTTAEREGRPKRRADRDGRRADRSTSRLAVIPAAPA